MDLITSTSKPYTQAFIFSRVSIRTSHRGGSFSFTHTHRLHKRRRRSSFITKHGDPDEQKAKGFTFFDSIPLFPPIWSSLCRFQFTDFLRSLPFSQFVADGVFYAELNEVLTRELAEDGYSGVEVRVTPMRTEIIIRATRTQNVLGDSS